MIVVRPSWPCNMTARSAISDGRWLRSSLALPLLSALVLAWLPVPADAQIRRCSTPGGGTTYTDRACADIGGVERTPRDAAASGRVASTRVRGCMRNLQDLIFELTVSIDSRDGNRLAGIYHWTGMSSSAGYALIGRLDAIAQRPLLDVVPVVPEPPTPSPLPVEWESRSMGTSATPVPTSATPSTDANAPTAVGVYQQDDASPSPPTPQRPVALRVEQTLSNGSTPSRTIFRLRRNMGCWWISF